MPENFMREVLGRLDHLVEKTDTIAERAENAAHDSAKARTGNRLLTIAVAIMAVAVIVAGFAVYRANDAATQAKDAATQAKALAEQQTTDREAIRLGGCQTRNSAQEAGRRSSLAVASASAVAGLTTFSNGIAAELPEYTSVLQNILDQSISAAQQAALEAQPKFYDIDTDCNFDAVFTSADYDSIVPDFGDESTVPVPPDRTTTTTTIQPGD